MPTTETDHPITRSRRSPDSSRSLKAHILLVLMTLIWGSTFVLNKRALLEASPLFFNAVRMSLAAILLAVYYRRQLARLTQPALWAGINVGIFLFLGYAFQITGLHLTTPSKSAFLTGISTVLVPLLLILIWKAHINHWRAVGIVTAFVGLFFMTVPPGRQGIVDFANVNNGDLLSIACAFGFAFQIILIGRASQRFPFEQIAVLQMVTAALLTTIATPVMERPHLELSATVITAILVTGILGTAVAFTVQAWAQQFTPATHAALIFTLEPVFAWLTSFIVLKERLGIRAGAGALLILAGVLISELLGNVARPEQALAEG